MRKGIFLTFLFLFSFLGYLLPDRSDAIPYFSRKYNTPCTMCHVQFPLLNATGMTFKQNGYRLKGEEGEFIWQNKLFPVSGMVVLKYKFLNRKGAGWTDEGGLPEDGTQSIFLLDEVEFFSAGTIAPRVSYYISLGSEEEADISPGIAFIIFDNILPESRVNIKAGKFYNEFLYLSNKRRLTLEPYMAPVTRTQYGIELNGELQPLGLRYAAGAANDEMTRDKAGETETNYKYVSNYVRAFYGWASYTILGHTLGIRGYTGKAGENLGVEEDHTQFDINLNLQFEPAILNIAYYTQSNVEGIKDSDQFNILTELIFIAGPQLLFNLRYEMQNRDILEDEDSKYIFNANYYISPNIGLTGEYAKQEGKESRKDEDKLQLGIQMVF